MQFEYSNAGLALTQAFEGVRLTAYRDSAGVLTIGWGHTGPDVHDGMVIDRAHAVELLRQDIRAIAAAVNQLVTVDLNQHQFDALVDFAFNLGVGTLKRSSLLKCVNAGDFAGAAGQFMLFVNAGGKILPGLVRRRAAERALFSQAA